MSVAAVAICEDLRLSFARVFSQQFVLSPKGDLSLPGFQEHSFAGWHLYVGGSLPLAVARMKEKSRELVVLGRAVDADGHLVTSAHLEKMLPKLTDVAALQTYVAGLGGRYVAFVHSGRNRRCYLDPSGSMGVVANRENCMVGSTLYMVMTDRVRPESDYPQGSMPRRVAFGYTADKDVRALTPNHYFDLSRRTETRYWPKKEKFSYRSLDDLDEGIEKVVQRHGQIIRALSEADGPVILPLSGGEDTRQLLAMTIACDCPIDLRFSHITTWKTQSDAEIAQQLCDLAGLEMEVYRCDDAETALRPRVIRRLLTERAVASGAAEYSPELFTPKVMGKKFHQVGRELVAAKRLPPGGSVLRGNVGDISKAVLWRQVGIRAYTKHGGAGIPSEIGVKLLMLDGGEAQKSLWFQEQYAKWLASLPAAAQNRSIDFMGLEQFRANTHGTLFYTLNHNFYLSPACDRQIIQHLVSAPPRLRHHFHYNDRLLAATVPVFRDIGYTRGNDNLMRLKRPTLDSGLKLYELQHAA